MYMIVIVFTILVLVGLNKLQKGLLRDIGFLWLVIIDLKLINFVEEKEIFHYLILILFGVMFYLFITKRRELIEMMTKTIKEFK